MQLCYGIIVELIYVLLVIIRVFSAKSENFKQTRISIMQSRVFLITITF